MHTIVIDLTSEPESYQMIAGVTDPKVFRGFVIPRYHCILGN